MKPNLPVSRSHDNVPNLKVFFFADGGGIISCDGQVSAMVV